ncbi:MAG TPA: lysophospholipid acyltransferase family protein, partial [Thermodesulfobacteriota bacterium]|nr:lysophospholipid acyltransferase family protein [Thermodesulfobacteriota bacterium]
SKNQEEKMRKQTRSCWEKFLWGVTALGFNIFLGIIRILPERYLPTLGDWVGVLGYYTIPHRQKIAQENIKRVYGSALSPKQVKSMAKTAFKNISRDMMEVGLSYVSSPNQQFLKKNISVQGIDNLDNALKKGRGVIAISAHLGNFPLISAKLALLGYPFSLIAKDPKNIYLIDVFQEWRHRLGIGLIPYKPRYRCANEAVKVLRKNGIIMMLIDQSTRKKYGVYVDFFDHQLPTYSGPIVLATRTGAALVPMFIHRNQDNTETLHILPEITLNKDQEVSENLRAINMICEVWIKKYPGQWWWLHRRFRRAKTFSPK